MNSGKWISAAIAAVIMIFLGGLREMIFVNINEQLLYNSGQIEDYRVLDSLKWLQEFRSGQLEIFKWVLTVVFSLLFLFIGYIVLKKILTDAEGGRWLIYAYIGGMILSGFFFITGGIIGQQELGYTLSRVFMGALQSPFILMLMIPARMLVKRI